MKKKIITILAILGSLSTGLSGCPTCVGRIHEESPPFFSEEFYKPDNNESMDELYEQLIQQESSDQTAAEQANKKETS